MSLNTLHNLTLTEGQIGVILCSLEKSVKYADSEYIEEVDTIFKELEGTVDKYYDELEKKKAKQPTMEWDDGFTHYSECVDKLVEDMNSSQSVTQSQQ
jgi:hypothetical protein